MTKPQFSQEQWVRFIGGEGRVKGFYADSGTWTYAVEMVLNPNPALARLGDETTVLLQEADLLPGVTPKAIMPHPLAFVVSG